METDKNRSQTAPEETTKSRCVKQKHYYQSMQQNIMCSKQISIFMLCEPLLADVMSTQSRRKRFFEKRFGESESNEQEKCHMLSKGTRKKGKKETTN